MIRASYLVLVPVVLLVALLPFAAFGIAPSSLTVSALLLGIFHWSLLFGVVLGIERQWRLTRVLVAVMAVDLLTLALARYYLGHDHLPGFLIKLACYSVVIGITFKLALPLRGPLDHDHD